MQTADDLINEANSLADALRRRREAPRGYGSPDRTEIATMTAQLADLWARIRAARTPSSADAADPSHRTRPKWD